MHAPLIISAPGYKSGQRVNSLAEMVDIYPTLCELAGLELPPHLQGKSLVPTMKNPNSIHKKQYLGVIMLVKRLEQSGFNIVNGLTMTVCCMITSVTLMKISMWLIILNTQKW